MGERTIELRHINFHKKASKYERERSINLRDIHLHKKANKYGRDILHVETNSSSKEGE